MRGKRVLAMVSMTCAALGVALPAWSGGTSLPAEEKQGSIAYVSGGIGSEEAKAMERAAKNYPLSLEFVVRAQPRDEFTSNVKVMVKDSAGKVVLDTVSKGPFLLARLPSGKYVVTAAQGGEPKTHRVHVEQGSNKRVIFEWNQPVSTTARGEGRKG
jgi:hypothetical protein